LSFRSKRKNRQKKLKVFVKGYLDQKTI